MSRNFRIYSIFFYFCAFFENKTKMETLKHECGVAMVRLLKPLEFYKEKYGEARWEEAVEASTRDMIQALAAETTVGRL